MRYIYSLSDPNTKEIRYIGQTNNIDRRLRDHINTSINPNNKYNTHKSCWIRKLLNDGLKPEISIIESVNTLEDSNLMEKFYIEKFTNDGFKLTNSYVSDVTDFSAETKEKMSSAKKGIVGNEKAKELKIYYSNRTKENNPNKNNDPLVREKNK